MEQSRTRDLELEELPPLESEKPQERSVGKKPQPSSGRGKRGPRAARSSTSSSEGSSKEARLKQIGQDLDATFVLVGTALSPFAPVTGTTLVVRGPQGSDIILNIARKDERVFRALLAISKYAVYGELAMFIGALGIAITVDLGQQDPNSFIVQRMLGGDILEQVYAQRARDSAAAPAQQPISAVPTGWSAGT